MIDVAALLGTLHVEGGSDLHLSAGEVPRIRRHGRLVALDGAEICDEAALDAGLRFVCPPDAWALFESRQDADFAIDISGVARFRANLFRHAAGPGAVFRVIPEVVKSLESLGMPRGVAELARLERGLVLVSGPTGSGKSTTLAALIDQINRTRAVHILTLEDPIEFVHSAARSVISHREVGRHCATFGDGMRGAIRQDADVILVGEMRDPETIALALTAAEMGALVFGTLHTHSAARSIDRIRDAFPTDRQPQILAALAGTIEAVICQRLLPNAAGDARCAAVEVLLRTPGLGALIREGKTAHIQSEIQAGGRRGMQTLDDALDALLDRGEILAIDAWRAAEDKARFTGRLDGAP